MIQIFEYLKDNKNRKVGILFAENNGEDKKVKIGYSKCHQKFDVFNKDIGFDIAKGRARKHSDLLFDKYQVPFIVQRKLPKFIDRCQRYFKDKKLPKWTKKTINQ